MRDANTKTFLNPDGSYTSDVYMAPIHWQDSDGNWQEIKSDLVEDKTQDGYDLVNASNAWRARMAKDTAKGNQFALEAGDKKMALNLTGYGNAKPEKDKAGEASTTEALSLEQAPASECKADKNRASWKMTDLFSLEYIVTGVAVEQLIILESPEAPNAFSFSLDMTGLEVKQDDLGYLRFFNSDDGTEAFSITPAVMKDSNVDPGSGDSAVSFDVSMELSSDKRGRSTLTMTADPAWLADPARVYPVYIDPSIKDIFPIYQGQDEFLHGDAYASSTYPNSNFGCDWDPNYGFFQLKSGYYNSGTGHNRSAICFDVRSFFHYSADDPDGSLYNWGANITSSTFYAYCYHSYYPSAPTQTWLHYATTDWGEDSLTWNNFPQTSYIANGNVCQGDWFAYDVTSATQMWVAGEENGGWANRGFVLDENGSTDPGLWKKFASWENPIEYSPRLRVNYTMVGVTTNTDEIPVKMENSDSRSANLFVHNTGEEDWQCKGTNPTNPVQVEAYLTDRSGGSRQASVIVDLPRDVKPGQTISVSVPVNAPATGSEWRINFDMRRKDLYTFSSRGCNPAQVDLTCVSAYPSDTEREASARLGKLGWMSYAAFPMGKVSGTLNANLLTGNATCSHTDLSVSGRGVPFSIMRTYNSLAPERATLFGPGWFSNMDVKVVEYMNGENPSGYLAFYDAQGTSYLLLEGKKAGTFVSPEGAYFKAERNPSFTNPGDSDDNKNWKYKVTSTSGVAVCFDASGKLLYYADVSNQTDASGKLNYKNKTKIVYSSGYPTQVVDASGRTFTIATSGSLITSVSEDASWASGSGHQPRTVTYDYDSGRLTQAALTGDHFVQYQYNGAGSRLSQVAENADAAGVNRCFMAYNASNQLSSFRDARSADSGDPTYKTAVIYGSGYAQLESPSISSDVPLYAAHNVKARYYMDSAGHCTTKYTGLSGTTWLQRVDYTWNACHQNLQVTNYGTNTSTILGSTYLTYDGKGNVSRVEDELNGSETAVSTTDHAASSNCSENATETTTPDGDKVSLEYNAGESYFKTVDKAGAQAVTLRQSSSEVARESVTLPSTYRNLVANPSFERGAGPVADEWVAGGSSGLTFSQSIEQITDFTNPNAGRRYQRISLTGANTKTGYIYVNQQSAIAVSPSTDYIFDVCYRNQGSTGIKNAWIIRQYDASMNSLNKDITLCPYKQNEWTQQSCSFKTEYNAAYAQVFLRVGVTTIFISATTDFDSVQLYRGTRDTIFNGVENMGFEYDLGSANWTASGGNVTRSTDKYVSPGNCLKIVGNGYATQNVAAKPNTRYLVTGYVWSEGEASQYQGAVFNYACQGGASGTLRDQSAFGYYDAGTEFIYKTGKWVRVYDVIETAGGTSYVTLKLQVIGTPITAYFDDIQFTELPDDTAKDYDTRNNYVTSTTDPLGQTGYLAYDPVGNVVQARDARSDSSSDTDFLFSYTYNELNQLLSVVSPDVSDAENTSLGTYDASYEYDNAGRMTDYTDNRENVTDFTHNALDKVSSKTDPLARETEVLYNEAGGVRTVIYPSGWEAYFSYDHAGRLDKVAYWNPGSQPPSVSTRYCFYYDAAGNLTTVKDGTGATTLLSYTYDKASRVTSTWDTNVSGGGNFSGTYTYTKEGKPKRVTYSKSGWGAGAFVEYSYGETGELSKLNLNNQKSFSYVYDDRGRLSTQYIPDNSDPSNVSVMTLAYDAAGRPTKVAHSTREMRYNTTYAYDEVGNITSQSQPGQTNNYAYDEMSRLTTWTNATTGVTTRYYYDGNGNITQVKVGNDITETHTYDDANQILDSGFTYDANGNLTHDGYTGWTYWYDWADPSGRLMQAANSGQNTIVQFEYDAKGRRTHKKVFDYSWNLKAHYYYHYDANGNILCETDISGNVISSYAYDPAGHPVAYTSKYNPATQTYDGTVRTYYLHTNAHGDVTFVTRDDGIWVKKFFYDPWGKLVGETSRNDGTYGNFTGLRCSYTYAGYYYDSETGLYCMLARYYSPTLRRFLQKDSHPGNKSNPLSLNPYQYCYSNPVLMADQSGLLPDIAFLTLMYFVCLAITNNQLSVDSGVKFMRGAYIANKALKGEGLITINRPTPRPAPTPSGPSFLRRLTNFLWTIGEDAVTIGADYTEIGGWVTLNPVVIFGSMLVSDSICASKAYHITWMEDNGFINEEQERALQLANGLALIPGADIGIDATTILFFDLPSGFGWAVSAPSE